MAERAISSDMGESGMSDTQLGIYLDTSEPIELVNLTLSFSALAFQYKKYLRKRLKESGKGGVEDSDVRLYLVDIRRGSLEAYLASAQEILGQYFTIMEYRQLFVDFLGHVRGQIEYFMGFPERVSPDVEVKWSREECKQIESLLGTAVNAGNGGKLKLKVFDYKTGESHVHVEYGRDDAYKAQQGAIRAQQCLDAKGKEAEHKSVSMCLYQTNIDGPKGKGSTGYRAIINDLWDKPLPVYFVSTQDQERFRYILEQPDVNPYALSLIVDVNVQVKRDQTPVAYRVIRWVDTLGWDDEEAG